MKPSILKKKACRADKMEYFNNFGQIALLEDYNLTIPSNANDNQLQVIFEEFLFSKFIYEKSFNFEQFKELKFFDTDIKASEFMNAKSASYARVPLDNSQNNQPPAYMHLWLFEELITEHCDHRKYLKGTNFIPENIKIFISCSNGKIEDINGQSWQLAAQLAIKALKENKAKVELSKWIITGSCELCKVDKIKLGNKLDLDLKKKNWLIPSSNKDDIAPKYEKNLIIRTASTLDDAWSHITGESHKEGLDLIWEDNDYDELHILIGGNYKANISSALLAITNKIVLWTSESPKFSIQPAQDFKKVIKELLPDIDITIKNALVSKELRTSEQALLNYFAQIATNKRILFNVTSGNRIMSYAVQSAARLYPNIELIYKEQGDNISGSFIHFDYKEFPPYSSFIKTENISNQYNWDFLNNKDSYKGADDFIKQLKGTKKWRCS